ncbi:MAG: AAA family ATPase [Deltaproteobacteria bacterium]|nr:AAA family ATPase [Deltaproteobacteria bacterium]
MDENGKTANGMQKLRPLLPDTAILEQFVENDAVVVDKTKDICRLLTSPIRTYFLSRPRRFGKSLLLDTISNIFEGRRELFKDMEIGRDGSGYGWETYPVINLSFGGVPLEPSLFEAKMLYRLNKTAKFHRLSIEPAKSVTDIESIIDALSTRHQRCRADGLESDESGLETSYKRNPMNVVLLIDEYDFPLLGNIGDDTKTKEIRKTLYQFYSAVKACEGKLRFMLVTGISKFKQLSLFSGMNNIEDISLKTEYSSICGFTKDEIISNFSSHIMKALSVLKNDGYFEEDATFADFMNELKSWYDGYTWDSELAIYNPYSIAKCLIDYDFDNYWYNSGSSLVTYMFKNMSNNVTDIFSGNLSIDNFDPVKSLKDMKPASFLFHTGYLTIDKIDKTGKNHKFTLKCPNSEIASAIANDFIEMDSPFPGFKGSIAEKYANFTDAFEASDDEECARIFTSFLGESAQTLKTQNESTYQTLLFLLLKIKGDFSRLEEHSGDGRPDLIYNYPRDFSVAVEIKHFKQEHAEKVVKLENEPPAGATLPMFPDPPDHIKKKLENGIIDATSQIITRRYLTPFYKKVKEVRACAVAIYGWTHCRFRFFDVDWNSRTIKEPRPHDISEEEKTDTDSPDSNATPTQE